MARVRRRRGRRRRTVLGNHGEEREISMRSRLRRARSKKWATLVLIAMTLSPQGTPLFEATASAQAPAPPTITTAPVGSGLVIVSEDLQFVFHQIEVAQAHVVSRTASNPCGTLLGPGPNQVNLFGQANPQ